MKGAPGVDFIRLRRGRSRTFQNAFDLRWSGGPRLWYACESAAERAVTHAAQYIWNAGRVRSATTHREDKQPTDRSGSRDPIHVRP